MDVERFRQQLLEERSRVEHALSFLHEDNQGTMGDESGEPGIDQHIADSATVTLDREIDESLELNEQHVLQEIDAALVRIEKGSFGTCEHCHQPIPEERLEALPQARFCIACQRSLERG
ncbi:MAG: TraR/DksA C4-type zinc finger protein [Thermoleophilia bacterium]